MEKLLCISSAVNLVVAQLGLDVTETRNEKAPEWVRLAEDTGLLDHM
jgi:hypothetical protein